MKPPVKQTEEFEDDSEFEEALDEEEEFEEDEEDEPEEDDEEEVPEVPVVKKNIQVEKKRGQHFKGVTGKNHPAYGHSTGRPVGVVRKLDTPVKATLEFSTSDVRILRKVFNLLSK